MGVMLPGRKCQRFKLQDVDNLSECGPGRDRPPKEEMRPLWYSKRVIEQEELASLAHNIGANWKAVGNGLKFNWAQLDQFEVNHFQCSH